MHMCRHIERGVNLEKLSALSKSRLAQCEACTGKAKLSQKKGARLAFSTTQQSCQHEEKWVCLACGHVACDSLLSQQSVAEEEEEHLKLGETKVPAEGHAWGHFVLLKHPLAMQIGENNVYWCFVCRMPVDYPVPSAGSLNDSQSVMWRNPLQEAADVVRERMSKKKGLFKDSAKVCYTMEPVRVVIDTVRSVIDSATHLKVADVTRHSSSLISTPSFSPENKRIVKGLSNLGNTCFFNSVLQNLLALDVLRNHFCRDAMVNEGPLTSSLRSLFQDMNSEQALQTHWNASNSDFSMRRGWRAAGDAKVCNPSALFDSICAKAPRFRGFQQQDCHELLRYMLEGLNSEERGAATTSRNVDYKEVLSTSFNKVLGQHGHIGYSETSEVDKEHGKASEFSSVVPTLVGNVFGGQLSSTVHCLECGHVSIVYETMLDLSLQIPSRHVLKKRQACEEQETLNTRDPTSWESLKEDNKNEESPGTLEAEEASILSTPGSTVSNNNLVDSSKSLQADCFHSTLALGSDPQKMKFSDGDSCARDIQICSGSVPTDFLQESLHSLGMPENTKLLTTKADVLKDFCTSDISYPVSEKCIDLGGSKIDMCENMDYIFDSHLSSEFLQHMVTENSIAADNHAFLDRKPFLAPLYSTSLSSEVLLQQDEQLETEISTECMGLAGHDLAATHCGVPNLLCKDGNEISKPGATDHIKASPQHSGRAAPVEKQETDGVEAREGFFNNNLVSEMPNLMDFSRQANCGVSGEARTGLASEQFFEHDDNAMSVTLEECLADFVKSELLCGENAWECEKCSRVVGERLQSRSTNMESKLVRGHSLIEAAKLSDECAQANGKKDPFVDAKALLRFSSMNFEVSSAVSADCDSKADLIQDGCANGNTFEEQYSILEMEDQHNVSKMERKYDPRSFSVEKSTVAQSISDKHEQQEGNGLSRTSSNTLPTLKMEKFSFLSNIFFKAENNKAKADQQQTLVKRRATKKLLICKIPLVLTIHLKRFAQDFGGRLNKLSGHVAFSEILNLQPVLDPRSSDWDDCIYRLVGIVEHGGTMRGGHYVAYVRCTDDEKSDPKESSWYHISDSAVSKRTLKDVLGREAYLLFYERHKRRKEG